MSSGISLLFLGGIIVSMVLFVDSSLISTLNEYLHYQCADHNDLCNPTYKIPCCNQSLACTLVDSYNRFKCIDRGQLGRFCKTNDDCKYIPHAECSLRNTCVCKIAIVVDNDVKCGPPLGEVCEDHELCGPHNSICFDNKCECSDGYLPLNDRRCLPILLDTYCEDDKDCRPIKYAECSKDNICTCSLNTTRINSIRCKPDSNFVCKTNRQCEENALCINNKCQCMPKLKYNLDRECVPAFLGMKCEHDKNCNELMQHTMCSKDKKCVCDDFSNLVADSRCESIMQIACDTCADDFIYCINDKCYCRPDYVYQDSKCVRKQK